MAKGSGLTEKPQPSTNKTVSMKKAENGYVVSSWDDRAGKDRVMIAKDVKEAKAIAANMLGT